MMAPTGKSLTEPVVLIIFNRPEQTRRVFDAIALGRPSKLFVVADGPRGDHAEDENLVARSRSITEEVDWPCQITRIYSRINLGCRERIVSGLNQVFDEVRSAIILEDDCVPHEDFFPFATTLLNRWRDEDRLFSIGGHIWEFPDKRGGESYFFSKYFSSWGWATWADRWSQRDAGTADWPELRMSGFVSSLADSPMEVVYWESIFDRLHARDHALMQAWDYEVQFTMWKLGMLAARPFVNLVQNVGLGAGGTHTTQDLPAVSRRTGKPLDWPLRHPELVIRNQRQDQIVNEIRLGGSLMKRLRDRP
jgi:hypothetical protein